MCLLCFWKCSATAVISTYLHPLSLLDALPLSAGNRRRFLDRLVLAFDPRHAQHSNRYEAALRARGKLLADPASADQQWLASLEAQLDRKSTRLNSSH